jgi:hypothetical protein
MPVKKQKDSGWNPFKESIFVSPADGFIREWSDPRGHYARAQVARSKLPFIAAGREWHWSIDGYRGANATGNASTSDAAKQIAWSAAQSIGLR